MVLSSPALAQHSATSRQRRHATLITALVTVLPRGVTSHDDGPGVRRSVTDCPSGRPLSLQLPAAEITCAPRAQCTAALQHCSHSNCSQMEYLLPAPDTQSLMYEENSFIQSHIFVIASILSPKTQVKEVFSFFQCAYFRPEYSLYTC